MQQDVVSAVQVIGHLHILEKHPHNSFPSATMLGHSATFKHAFLYH